jgi:hypothetical protein
VELVLLHQMSYCSELSSKEAEFPLKVSLAENDGRGDLVLFGAVEMMGLLSASSETLTGEGIW